MVYVCLHSALRLCSDSSRHQRVRPLLTSRKFFQDLTRAALLLLANQTRPDVAFAVAKLARRVKREGSHDERGRWSEESFV